MKKQFTSIHLLLGALLMALSSLTACNDYLNEIPKGQKTPVTWADYNAFIKNASTYHYHEMDQLFCLVGDLFKNPNQLNSSPYLRANYLWDETVNRIDLMTSSDKNPYYSAYEGIFAWNLIVDDGESLTECTEDQRKMLVAQARVLRDMTYYYLANYYAAPYSEANLDKLSVPLVTSANVESASPQVTIKALYDFLVGDLKAAIDYLPTTGETIFHPNKATGYGMLARVYLTMGDYTNALTYANLALKENSTLYDWIAFYEADQERFDTPTNYSAACKSDPEKTSGENYIYRYSSMAFWSGNSNASYALTPERAAQFEQGDTRLLTHWKYRVSSSGIEYYSGIYALEPNKGGMRAAEMYYIKAECLARQGGEANINEAMELVNTVRKTRILPEYYTDWTASTTHEAVEKIIQDKASEYVQSQVIFCDYRRLNQDSEYARTLTRTVDGVTYTLSPTSHLWIQPFPIDAVTNPGNGTITQNVDR